MEACIQTYGGLIYSIAKKHVRTQTDAEDLAQEIFMALWRVADRFDASLASETTFVGMVARRRSIDWTRREGRRPVLVPMETEVTEGQWTSNPHPSHNVDHEAVMQVVATLPDETQRLFRLHIELGKTHSEIAEETGTPLGTVKTKLRTGLIHLRKAITQTESPNPAPQA